MTTLKSLFDIQTATKMEIEGLNNHNDIINTHILMSAIYLSQLLPSLGLQSMGKAKIKKGKVLETCVKVVEHIMLLCNACNYEIPEQEDLFLFEKEIPIEIRNDAILTTMGMIGAVADIAHVINVDLDQPIWSEVEIPDEFDDDIFTIIVGVKSLGIKYGFTMDDVLARLV